jgi:hypothetical protein
LRRRLPVLALGLVAVMLFSGCFVLRGFRFTKAKIFAGGNKVVAVLSLYPHGHSNEGDEISRPFIVVQFPDDTREGGIQTHWRAVNPKVFDVDARFGNNPRELVQDNTLETAVLADSGCSEIPTDEGALVVVLRTNNNVNADDKVSREALTRIGLKATADADTTGAAGEDNIAFHVGLWDDDGDLNPESAEIDCTSHLGTSLPIFAQP